MTPISGGGGEPATFPPTSANVTTNGSAETTSSSSSPAATAITVPDAVPVESSSTNKHVELLPHVKRSMRQNLLPGIVLFALALILLILYYTSSEVNSGFDKLGALKTAGSFGFSCLSTAICAGLIPFTVLTLRDLANGVVLSKVQPPEAEAESRLDPAANYLSGIKFMIANGVFLFLFWGYKGIEVDAFYRLQGIIFGNHLDPQTIVAKMFVDQFIYNPVWSAQSVIYPYFWRDCGFSYRIWRKRIIFREVYTYRLPIVLVPTWILWVPAVTIIYAFPPNLQIPLFNIVICFFSLLLAFVTKS